MNRIALFCFILISAGCAHVVTTGSSEGDSLLVDRLLLPPFTNATDDQHASRALTEMTGSALVQAGIALYQTEELVLRTSDDEAQGGDGRYAEIARSMSASHLLIGTVHEYRYKTDLDGDPAVGITMRIVEASSGRTVWQGTSANVGYAFASVTSAGQKAVNRLVAEMPIAGNQSRGRIRIK